MFYPLYSFFLFVLLYQECCAAYFITVIFIRVDLHVWWELKWYITLYTCSALWCVQIIRDIMTRWSFIRWFIRLSIRLFARNTTPVSSLSRSIWKYWSSKMLARCILSWVCVNTVYSLHYLSYNIKGAVCIQLTHYSYNNCENMFILFFIIIKSEIWLVWHRNNGIRCICLFIFSHFLYPIATDVLGY